MALRRNPDNPRVDLLTCDRQLRTEAQVTAGERLEEARGADREWRKAHARRLHGHLRVLRQSETVIPRIGIGLGLLLLSGAASPLLMGSRESAFGLGRADLQVLILGAVAVLVGSLVAILAAAWYQDRLGRRLLQLGISELLPEWDLTGPPGTKPTVERWICSRCWDQNEDRWSACTNCGAARPFGETRLRGWLRRLGKAAQNVSVDLPARILTAVVALLILAGVLHFVMLTFLALAALVFRGY